VQGFNSGVKELSQVITKISKNCFQNFQVRHLGCVFNVPFYINVAVLSYVTLYFIYTFYILISIYYFNQEIINEMGVKLGRRH
jgi:uncharacterized protein (DUF1919 family)